MVLQLSQCLIVAAVVYLSGVIAGHFTDAPLVCPGEPFTFRCTVTGNKSGVTTWRVNGSSECNLFHRSNFSSICGPSDSFTARPGTGYGTSATSFTSTLSGTVDPTMNGTLVECFGPANNVHPGNRINGSTLEMLGLPPVPTISCVDLSEDVSGAVNVTVRWTLSDADSADFYLMKITSNTSQTPYHGLLNITNASVTQYELTDFIVGHEYNITVHGVNCGKQEGGESEPLTITPQVPGALRSCNITLTYNQSTERLQFINSTWNAIPYPMDPMEACQGPKGVIIQYQIRFQSGSVEKVNIARCKAGRCSHTFEPPSNPPTSYDSVSVAAENVVGVGAATKCTAQPINTTNNLLVAEVENISSPNNATINCTFLSGFTGSAHCQVQYGTDPTYMNLPYFAESTETGTAGDTVSVVLREQLNSSTVYYYTVSAVSGDVTVRVLGNFTTPQYSCSLMELWDLSTTSTTFLRDVSLLDNAAQYQSCVTGSVGSAVLKDIRLSTSTVAYYTGITPGSKACFVCDENSGYELNTTTNERICQSDATWSEGPIKCVPKTCTQQRSLMGWHITLIVIGVLALVVSLVIIITVIVVSCYRMKGGDGSKSHPQKGLNLVTQLRIMLAVFMHSNKMKWWYIIVIVVAVIFCLIGVVLWITVGAVVTNPPDDNTCDPGWHHSCDALVILGFLFSLFPIILVPTVPTIYTPLRGLVLVCCNKCGVKSKPRHSAQPGRSIELQLEEYEAAVPGYDIIQHNQARPRAVPDSNGPSYSLITEVPSRLRYAELGPHIPSAAVAPPPIDNNVWYTSLLHDQKQLQPIAIISTGSLLTSDDAKSNSQSPLGSPPPIPPQQFSGEDILLLPKLSESMELQKNGGDTPPQLPPEIKEQDIDLPPLPPKVNEEDMALPLLSPKINTEDTGVPPHFSKINTEDISVPPLPPKINTEDTGLPPHLPKFSMEDKPLPPLPPKINAEDTGVPPLPPKAKRENTVLPSCPPKTNQEEGVIRPHPSKVKQEDTTLPPLPPKRERKDTALYSCPPKANQEDALLPPLPPKVIQENTAPPPLPPKRHQQNTLLQPSHPKANQEET